MLVVCPLPSICKPFNLLPKRLTGKFVDEQKNITFCGTPQVASWCWVGRLPQSQWSGSWQSRRHALACWVACVVGCIPLSFYMWGSRQCPGWEPWSGIWRAQSRVWQTVVCGPNLATSCSCPATLRMVGKKLKKEYYFLTYENDMQLKFSCPRRITGTHPQAFLYVLSMLRSYYKKAELSSCERYHMGHRA